MKKIFTLLLASSIGLSTYAQFADDFESYNLDDYLAQTSPIWSTWSGAGEGTNEDVNIADASLIGGNQCVYFSSSDPNGGPQDVVLPFNTVFEQGNFAFSADFYIPAQSTGAYFNFQASTTIGETWTLNSHIEFDQINTSVRLTNSLDTTLIEIIDGFAPNTWFTLKISADLTENNWEVFINDISQGTFTNTNTQIASIDLYPVEGNMFYIDNVLVETPNQLDAELTELTSPTTAEIPAEIDITGVITNLGNETITEMDITWTNGAESYEYTLTDLNILPLSTYNFTHDVQIGSDIAETVMITVTISNINGLEISDDNPLNDEQSITINFEEPAPTFNCINNTCVDPGDGSGEFSSYAECIFNSCESSSSINENESFSPQLTPNPTSNNSILNIIVDNKDVTITITNLAGQLISRKYYENLDGEQLLDLNTSSLENGVYLVDININGNSSVHKLIKH